MRCAHEQVKELGGNEQCTMIGGGKTAIDRAAFFNSALVRYLDFMDSFLAKGGGNGTQEFNWICNLQTVDATHFSAGALVR